MEDQIALAQSILDEFEQVNHIKSPPCPSDLDDIWAIPLDKLEHLSPEKCAAYSYILAQYSIFVQKILNIELSKLNWLENRIDDICCEKLASFDQYTKHNIKLRLLAKENEPFRKLLQHAAFTKQKILRLEYIPSSIKVLSDKLENIQRVKSLQLKVDNGFK